MTLQPGETVQSQYASSATIRALIESARIRIAPDADIELFYKECFDIETCRGVSLDNWGVILGIGRNIDVEDTGDWFGFEESDYEPFDQAPFWDGETRTKNVRLSDDAYRHLLMWKALANISTADAASLNNLLQGLFQGKEVVVHEIGIMAIELYIFFPLEPYERAILREYGLFARGAGVGFKWTEIALPCFGFFEADYEPFDQAPFWDGGGNLQNN